MVRKLISAVKHCSRWVRNKNKAISLSVCRTLNCVEETTTYRDLYEEINERKTCDMCVACAPLHCAIPAYELNTNKVFAQ